LAGIISNEAEVFYLNLLLLYKSLVW